MSTVDVTLRTNVDQYYIMASSAFFFYDFALTIPQEVKHMWSTKLSLVNVLVIGLRYLTVLGFIPVIVFAFAPFLDVGDGGKSVPFLSFFLCSGIIGIVCQGMTLVLLIIRIHAIYDKKRWILYLTVPFAILSVGLASLVIGTASVMSLPNINGTNGDVISASCFTGPNLHTNSPLFFKLLYIAIILFDTLIFVLALVRMGAMRLTKESYSSLVLLLLRDGTILYAYVGLLFFKGPPIDSVTYSVLAISNISSFLLFMLFIDGPESAIDPNSFDFVVSSGTNSEMTHVLSVVFVPRMIFNLRDLGTEISEGTDAWRTRVEQEEASIRFRVPTTILSQSSDCPDDSNTPRNS
ncbi:hypothetical protein SCHPADRAFT_947425 [Schizopora paradoxa]|uniref:DUF6533 domain-containing protein n=1 Tax=Schizopora paradoxa TaxID=27342 RepID=A0A0H2QZI0_9AGAM|nr:hypothetical protein SCHPADRAFT_947425 [Schizopora paradoxa]